MREVRSIGEGFISRLPYYGNSLDPVRNFLGEPVRKVKSVWSENSNGVTDLFLPLAYREVSDDFVDKEISILQHPFQPPQARRGGVDLTTFKNAKGQSAYDRRLELRGEVKIGGVGLRVALRKLMRSPEYQKMDPVSTLEDLSPRVDAVNAVIRRYDRKAVRMMRQEFPAVRSEIERVLRESRARRSGGVIQQLR